MTDPNFQNSQHTFWTEEEQKYQKLYIKKSFDKNTTEEEKTLYQYAMWYCQEQKAKYR